MARPNRPANPDLVGAHLARVFAGPPSEAELRTAGLDDRFPLDPDLVARGIHPDDE